MSINRACQLLGYSKQAWHKSQQNQARKAGEQAQKAEQVLGKVDEIRRDMPRLGTRKLQYLLTEAQVPVGRDALFALLRERGKLVKSRKKRPKTTDSSRWMRQFDNLVEDRVAEKPEEVLVSDITFFRTREEGFVYGHLVTDAYSKKLLGYEVADNLNANSSLKALKMALENRRYKHPFIHHSDRGLQYLAKAYTQDRRSQCRKNEHHPERKPLRQRRRRANQRNPKRRIWTGRTTRKHSPRPTENETGRTPLQPQTTAPQLPHAHA